MQLSVGWKKKKKKKRDKKRVLRKREKEKIKATEASRGTEYGTYFDAW